MKENDRRERLPWQHHVGHERIDGLALHAAALARERAPLRYVTLRYVLSLAMNALVVTGGPGVAGPPIRKFGLPHPQWPVRYNMTVHVKHGPQEST